MNRQSDSWKRQPFRRVSRRRAMGIFGAGAVAAYLAACGGDSDDSSSEQSQSQGGQQSAASSTPLAAAQGEETQFQQGKFGGKLAYGVTLEPGTLDTAIPVSGGDSPFIGTMFNSLVTFDHFVPNPNLSLAQKWEIVDPTTISFSLRPDIKFHDGTDFNAESVKYTYDRIMDPNLRATSRSSMADLDRVETPDALTANVILKSPNAAFFNAIGTIYGAGIVSRAAVEKWGSEFTSHPVGTGPFVFDQWVPGSHVTVKRNPTYWEKDAAGKALPYLDEVTLQVIPDETVRYANLQTGDIQITGLPSKDVAAAERNPDLNVVKGLPGASVSDVLAFNLDKAPLDNVNLRKAMAFAVDPAVVAKNVYFNLAVPAEDGMRQPDSWSYAPVPSRPKYDVAQAKQFLAAGGQPDGFSVDVITYASPTINQKTEIYQEQWSKLGIKAQITSQDVSTATNSYFNQQLFPIYSTSWGATFSEPNYAVDTIYSEKAFYNPMKRAISPELEDLGVKAKQTYDLEERQKLYQRIDEIVLVEQVYFIPQLYFQSRGGYRKNVGNYEIYPWLGFRLQSLFLK